MGEQAGRRRFVTVDLAGEDDPSLLAWIDEQCRKRRLSHEVRAGLRLRWLLSQQPLGELLAILLNTRVQPGAGEGATATTFPQPSPLPEGTAPEFSAPRQPVPRASELPSEATPGALSDQAPAEKLHKLLDSF